MMRIAWQQAVASLKGRLGRHLITGGGIALGVAFLVAMRGITAAEGSSDRSQWLMISGLVMCFIGISNAMLLSVAERYREVGTLKCLGASDALIVQIFLLESVLLGFTFSLLGAVIGALLATIGSSGWVTPTVVLESAGIGLFMTIAASILPAAQAARLPATAALRAEI